MSQVDVIKVFWTNLYGGVGLSQFAFEDLGTVPDGAFTAVDALVANLCAFMPTSTTCQVQQVAETFDVAANQLTGTKTAASGFSSHSGPGTAVGWAAGVGASITWNTGMIANGRRISGRMFVVPLTTAQFGSGVLGTTALSNIQGYASTFVSACASAGHPLQVWTRARAAVTADPATGRPARAAKVGAINEVTGATVKNQVATLRGRRL
jgi:hypothetical protein